MNRILSNHLISPSIIELIRKSEKEVILVSPYVKTWGHLESEIQSSINRGVKVDLIFRSNKSEEYKYSLEFLQKIGVGLYDVENLHTKLYLSEKSCILSSMNLYDYSSSNSEEIGIFITDPNTLEEIREYVRDLRSKSIPVKKSLFNKIGDGINRVKDVIDVVQNNGSCIRCGITIDFNPKIPMCPKCYSSWKRYKNPEFKEKFCHDCGIEYKTTIKRPVCKDCFKESVNS
ncbi:MAG: phosphatidylserine/phosphatidylglycerophosphate/cardiolipin synthase family protein [Candidatus Marinimicrobia bacterium]|jgi:phosphatidylserine/phosphatidylglycerophosphate/cardiolipin synthase-like enzyme|nr:phosphatidylserine/phosphatidylglycerophosphate/cardiolipin synthase family protein [Candidatus Neomarinimicrobiota bacterium]